MTDASPQVQLEQLRASLKVLEDQRVLLGPAIDPALEAVRAQIAALLAEEGGPTSSAASLHIENFAAYTAQEAATRSSDRLWQWWQEGRFAAWDLPAGSYAKFAKAAARAGEPERARAIFA